MNRTPPYQEGCSVKHAIELNHAILTSFSPVTFSFLNPSTQMIKGDVSCQPESWSQMNFWWMVFSENPKSLNVTTTSETYLFPLKIYRYFILIFFHEYDLILPYINCYVDCEPSFSPEMSPISFGGIELSNRFVNVFWTYLSIDFWPLKILIGR
jgi:hypothetical protein